MASSPDSMESIREGLVDDLYRYLLPFGVLAVLGALLRNHIAQVPGNSWVPGATMVGLVVLGCFRSRIGFRIRAWAFLVGLQLGGFSGMLRYGIAAPGIFLYPVGVVVAWLVVGRRAAWVVTGTGLGALVVGAWVNVVHDATLGRLSEYNRRPEFWLQIALVMCLCGGLILVTVHRLFASLRRQQDELERANAELEERIARRTRTLERSRRDFQAFSYAVSHDLKAPLRAIDGFARVLEEEGAVAGHAESEFALSRILAGAGRMGEIIDALLGMASIDKGDLVPQEVDTARMVTEIVRDLDLDARGRERPAVAWRIGDLPRLQAEPHLLRQALANLLSNAAKFSASFRADPVVEVSAESRPDGIWLAVRDNGPGFEAARSERLFRMFGREHGDEIEGMGIGLATVRRILDRLEGAIEVESAPGAGALFRIRPGPDVRGAQADR